jgi:hypothetical protein
MVAYRSLSKGLYINNSMTRPLCIACHGNPVAINYRSGDKIRYRKVCASCARKGKRGKTPAAAWQRTGYTKKLACDKCGFKSKNSRQFFVYYIDGNLKNNDWANLKTVCANCRIDINDSRTTWRESPLTPDF